MALSTAASVLLLEGLSHVVHLSRDPVVSRLVLGPVGVTDDDDSHISQLKLRTVVYSARCVPSCIPTSWERFLFPYCSDDTEIREGT